ncbi:MAG: hypothetical protein ABJQ34_01635 [Paracoccaceae bacterium]
MQAVAVVLASSVLVTIASASFLIGAHQVDLIDNIVELKVAVLVDAEEFRGATSSKVRETAGCDDSASQVECQESAAKAVRAWEVRRAKHQARLTRLAQYGITFDETNSVFDEDYSNSSPLMQMVATKQNATIDVLKLLVSPLILAVLAWVSSFWLRQYFRLDELELLMASFDSDVEMREALFANGKLLDYLK